MQCSHSPLAHVEPKKPSAHKHTAAALTSIQVAPFRHGLRLSWHAGTAKVQFFNVHNIYFLEVCFILKLLWCYSRS